MDVFQQMMRNTDSHFDHPTNGPFQNSLLKIMNRPMKRSERRSVYLQLVNSVIYIPNIHLNGVEPSALHWL